LDLQLRTLALLLYLPTDLRLLLEEQSQTQTHFVMEVEPSDVVLEYLA
jgi:hypothetical protein